MFKPTICLFVLAVASGAVSGASIGGKLINDVTTEKREIIPLLSFEVDKKPDGSFRFQYEGGDRSYREETGSVSNAGTDDEAIEVKGSYRYIDADGQEVVVHYTAGKNGFVPIGTNIPVEISNLAKAAADLPEYTEEQQRADRYNQRRARSKSEEQPVEAAKTLVAAEPVQAEPVQAETVVAAESVKTETVVPAEPVQTKTLVATEPVQAETVVAAESVKTETVVPAEPAQTKTLVATEPVVAAESVKTETVVPADSKTKTLVATEPVVAAESVKTETVVPAEPVEVVKTLEQVKAAEPAVAASELVPVKVVSSLV
ncbi:PREDICTED: uncharacterized protein LOC108614834 [Drosophila arizonae]|uniref:Uncharacterized protein LOC108614834 n=1 Tax=Drosophila arizonae TaxID=7263 RepID=A0ABM1PBF8_DROAR|nr:PREDICTED: uncharacterized protein LOC108614834 [Drosophila arizonae]